MTSKIVFKNGTELETLAVFSTKEIIENAYREKFEIRFPETVTIEQINAAATADNLAEIALKEFNESGEETASYTYLNFSMLRGVGFKIGDTGERYNALEIAQLSTLELAQKAQAAELAALQEKIKGLLAE